MAYAYDATCHCGAHARVWTRPDANTFLAGHTCRDPVGPPAAEKRPPKARKALRKATRPKPSPPAPVDAHARVVAGATPPAPVSLGWWVVGPGVNLGPFDKEDADDEAAEARADGVLCTVEARPDATATAPAA